MKILGNRVLVSRVEEEVKEGFNTVEVQDSFTCKGKVVEIGEFSNHPGFAVGDIALFAKYSPDTNEVDVGGEKMKIVRVEDILAIL